MEAPKRRKLDSESKTVHQEWNNLYCYVKHDNKATCLLCNETTTALEKQDLISHFETKHKKKNSGADRDEKVAKLRREFKVKAKPRQEKRCGTESRLKASYRVAQILSEGLRPFSDGECIKKCILAVVEELCPEKKDSFKSVNLSTKMITKRVEDMEANLYSRLKSKAASFEMFSIAVDGSTDSKNNTQLLLFIRGVNSSFEITEELATTKCMRTSTTPLDIYKVVSDLIQEYDLPWNKLVGVTTNGVLNMTGNFNGLDGRISSKVMESKGDKPLRLQSIIDHQSLLRKVLYLDHVIDTVVSIVNFFKTHASNHRIYKKLLKNIETKYEDVLSQSEVCWLGEGTVIRRFFRLRHEIDIFMRQKSNPVAQLKDPSWLWDLAFLCDITPHLSELISKMQRKEELISHLYANVEAFQAKLQLFVHQAKNATLVHFPTCAALRQEEKLSSYFPKTRITQLLGLLRNNFNNRFVEFGSWKVWIRLFENPFTANVLRYPNELRLELINLQGQEALLDRFRIMQPVEFYSKLPAKTFPNLRYLALKMITMFTSTHACKKAASLMKRAKCGLNGKLYNEHLDSVIRIGASSMQPEINTLVDTSINPSTTSREQKSTTKKKIKPSSVLLMVPGYAVYQPNPPQSPPSIHLLFLILPNAPQQDPKMGSYYQTYCNGTTTQVHPLPCNYL